MKTRPLAGLGLVFLVPVLLSAQAVSVPPAGAPLRPVSPGAAAPESPPRYEFTARWNERTQAQELMYANPAGRPLQVLGVQSTSGIFVADYPASIAAGQAGKIGLVHHALDHTDGGYEVIRLLTDQGIKEIHLRIMREAAVRFTTREVRWTVGGRADSQTVTLTVAPGTLIPQKTRVAGGHQASLEKVDDTTWQIRLTPASTARAGQFAVFVEFDQPLPGQAAVVLGVIQPQD